jgi:hypothetical protein
MYLLDMNSIPYCIHELMLYTNVYEEHFIREKYTFLNDFKVRQAFCKIRISAHSLMIEIGRYKNLETEERVCKLCITLKFEDEYHFLIDCLYINTMFLVGFRALKNY